MAFILNFAVKISVYLTYILRTLLFNYPQLKRQLIFDLIIIPSETPTHEVILTINHEALKHNFVNVVSLSDLSYLPH